MTKLARFRQQPSERKNYVIQYDNWLETGETITNVETAVDPSGEMTVTGVALLPGNKQVIYSVGGGEDGTEYEVSFTVTTSDTQTKQDEVYYQVDEI